MSVHIRHPLKSGVLGVIGVPESLEASNGAGFSDGTPAAQGRNTLCSEHQSCSAPTLFKRTQTLPFPAGLMVAQRAQQTPSAEHSVRIRGAGSDYMEDNELLELEHIGGLIASIEAHWECVNGNPDLASPASQVLDSLWQAAYINPTDFSSVRGAMRRSSAANAHWLAMKACKEPLTEAELNLLGWELTRLVALDVKLVKNALREVRAKGGVQSGKARKEANAERDQAICSAGKRLLASGFSHRDLAGVIAGQAAGAGLTTKSIRKILRDGGVKEK